MVEVFKTNVHSQDQAIEVINALQNILPFAKINFDLEDCDKILRIEDEVVLGLQIAEFLRNMKIVVSILD
jgi:predicted RNA binding protein with dsRBD fold (UPF0201 family)